MCKLRPIQNRGSAAGQRPASHLVDRELRRPRAGQEGPAPQHMPKPLHAGVGHEGDLDLPPAVGHRLHRTDAQPHGRVMLGPGPGGKRVGQAGVG